VRDGLDAFEIDTTLASRVHCSRATIYRYASGKAQMRDAVLVRLATRIIGTVRRAVDGLSGPDHVGGAATPFLRPRAGRGLPCARSAG
jgi:AcrR family transcriptional regulator